MVLFYHLIIKHALILQLLLLIIRLAKLNKLILIMIQDALIVVWVEVHKNAISINVRIQEQ